MKANMVHNVLIAGQTIPCVYEDVVKEDTDYEAIAHLFDCNGNHYVAVYDYITTALARLYVNSAMAINSIRKIEYIDEYHQLRINIAGVQCLNILCIIASLFDLQGDDECITCTDNCVTMLITLEA